jgi:hypothetical protein
MHNQSWLRHGVCAMLCGLAALLFCSASALAETVLTPRDKTAFEAEMRLLNEKYGPKKFDAEAADGQAPAPEVAAPAAEASEAAAADIDSFSEADAVDALASAQSQQSGTPAAIDKLRVELQPEDALTFRFNDKIYGVPELLPVLKALQQRHSIDYIVLMQRNAEPVSLTHIVELAKLSRELRAPAVYQDGTELRAVDAR